MRNKGIISILIILTIVFTLAGGTFAYLTWRGTNTLITFTLEEGFSCSVDGGGNITSSNVMLAPSTCTNSTYAIKRELDLTTTVKSGKVYLDLWINVDKLDTGLVNSQNFKYVLSTSSTSCETGVIASGSFNGKSAGVDVPLLESKMYTETTTDKYYLYVWLDKEETSTETMNQTFSLSLGGECTNNLSISAKTLVANANPSTLSYSDATTAQKGEMWTFSHDATSQTSATTDYRYIGASPNNYITFNNETWRIIGVFDGRIKIIKDTATSLSWDYKESDVGSSTSSYGSNDWTDSQLMYALNNNFLGTDSTILKTGYTYDGTYVKDGSGNIIYQNGCKPASIASGATTYSCTSLGWTLNSTALNQIDKVTYYLGGTTSFSGKSASSAYSLERGTTVPSGRLTNWSGYVGLMYASDYGYTYAFGVDDTCYNNLYSCTTSDSATPSSSWLFNSAYQWLLVPFSSGSGRVFRVRSAGDVIGNSVYSSSGVRGVVYLKSDIRLKGSGTSSDPYKIQ